MHNINKKFLLLGVNVALEAITKMWTVFASLEELEKDLHYTAGKHQFLLLWKYDVI